MPGFRRHVRSPVTYGCRPTEKPSFEGLVDEMADRRMLCGLLAKPSLKASVKNTRISFKDLRGGSICLLNTSGTNGSNLIHKFNGGTSHYNK